MNKVELLKKLLNSSQGNMFSVEISTTLENEKEIQELISVLETEKRIKLREYLQKENTVYIQGIIKYASD
ncbi:hypothetical protein L1999_14795 [Neobacillus drentensis]|uniref:hypothetical protein n=1 Tax=Neobacillus drentensis TaxID=220684 RepID=UPI001F3842CA|nr:hypothetical protein [Neobacillus drentensis]ULT54442.1 hypothetical protein L1999_14795 [Neobacillus drentensis]